MMRDNGTRKHFPPQEKTSLRHQTVVTGGRKPPSPHGNPGRAGRQGRRIPLPLPGVHHNAEKQKKSRADSLKSQRHPALEDNLTIASLEGKVHHAEHAPVHVDSFSVSSGPVLFSSGPGCPNIENRGSAPRSGRHGPLHWRQPRAGGGPAAPQRQPAQF